MAFDSALLTEQEIETLYLLTIHVPWVTGMRNGYAALQREMVMELFVTICEQRAALDRVREFARGK